MNDDTTGLNNDLTAESVPVSNDPASGTQSPTNPSPAEGLPTAKPWMLIMNGVLLVAVIILFVLHFTSKNSSDASISQTVAKAKGGSMAVAFVNNDTILQNYDLVKKLRKELEAKESRLAAEISTKQATFDKDAAYFQDQVQKKTISEQSAQEIYASLMQNQQKINELRDQYAAELQQNEMNMNVALIDTIMNFLDRYNKKYKFDYILGFNKGGNILYANDTLDITRSVLLELNLEYNQRNPGK